MPCDSLPRSHTPDIQPPAQLRFSSSETASLFGSEKLRELEHVDGKELDLLSKRGPNIGKLQHRMPQTQNSKMHRFREIRRPELAVMEKGISRLANHRQRLPMFGGQGHEPRPRYGARQPRPARQERPSAPAARLLPCRPTGPQLSIAAHFQVNHIF